jgi:transcriptional regulator with XRE-family HTH domain
MYLPQNLKYLREKKGITQEELSADFEVCQHSIGYWENADRTPDIKTIVRLAEYFGVSLDELVLKDLTPPKPMQARNLKYLRCKYEMPQKDMAKLLSVTEATAWKYENGKIEMPIEKLMIVSDYFGVTLDELIKQDLTERSEKTT